MSKKKNYGLWPPSRPPLLPSPLCLDDLPLQAAVWGVSQFLRSWRPRLQLFSTYCLPAILSFFCNSRVMRVVVMNGQTKVDTSHQTTTWSKDLRFIQVQLQGKWRELCMSHVVWSRREKYVLYALWKCSWCGLHKVMHQRWVTNCSTTNLLQLAIVHSGQELSVYAHHHQSTQV